MVLCAAKAKSRTAEYAGTGRVTPAADKVMGKNCDVVDGFANTLSVAALTFPLRRDDVDYVVFCFGKPEDAEVLRPSCGDRRRSYKNGRPGKTVLGPSSFQPMMVTTGRTGTPHRRHQSSQTARRGSELA